MENDVGAFLFGAFLFVPLCLIIFAIVRGKEKTHQALDKKWLFLILAMYILALFLPSATFFEEQKLILGAGFWLVGMVFFWALPVSLPFYANYLFFIVLIRLALGKSVRFFLAEITVLLMLGSLILPMQFAWGYLVWLVSGCLLWAAYRVAQKGAKPILYLKTLGFCALMCVAAWQLGEYQRRQPEIQKEPLFADKSIVFVSPTFFFPIIFNK